MFKKSVILLILFYVLSGLVACVTSPGSFDNHTSFSEFEKTIFSLTHELLTQVQQREGEFKSGQTKMVLDPFVDAASGDIIKASYHIEHLMMEEAQKQFPHLSMDRITPENLQQAHYVVSGAINFTAYEESDAKKNYRFSSSVLNKKTGKIVASSTIWISEKDLDYTPTPVYKDSPLYLKDRHLKGKVMTAESSTGQLANPTYYEGLNTNALLVEADTAYEKKDYPYALQLFNLAATRQDGQTLKTYVGLYETNLKLGDLSRAEKTFDKLLEIGLKENNKLNVKFLFSVDKIDFIEDEELKTQYQTWLHQINQFFQKNQYCFYIVGHSSRSGVAKLNKKLSWQRAKKVQQLMRNEFPEVLRRSRVIGKGFEENLVGSGTDDLRDAIDRRVEFIIVDCSTLNKKKHRISLFPSHFLLKDDYQTA